MWKESEIQSHLKQIRKFCETSGDDKRWYDVRLKTASNTKRHLYAAHLVNKLCQNVIINRSTGADKVFIENGQKPIPPNLFQFFRRFIGIMIISCHIAVCVCETRMLARIDNCLWNLLSNIAIDGKYR